MFVPPHVTPNSPDGAMGEGIAIDAAGNVYTAEAHLRGVTKYVKNHQTPPRHISSRRHEAILFVSS